MKRTYQSITIAVIAMVAVTLGSGITTITISKATSSGLSAALATPTVCTAAWSVVPSPSPGTSDNLVAVAAISSNDVWAVGEYPSGGNFRTLTKHGGAISATASPTPDLGTTYITLVEHWDGTSWSLVSSPNPGGTNRDNILSGVAAVSSNDVWAVGYYETVSGTNTLVEHWEGASWSVIPSPNPGISNVLYGIAAISSNDVWTVGYYSNGGYGSTLVEHWDGTSWSLVPSLNPGTSDNGLYAVTALSSSDVWVVGTLVEHWDGTSWSVVPNPNPGTTANALFSIAAISSNDVWVVGYYASGGNPRTLTEHWDGTSWSVVPSPNPDTGGNGLYGVTTISSSDVWAVGYSYSIDGINSTLIEHWDGTSWSVVPGPNPGTSDNDLYAVAALSSSDVWAVGGENSGNDVSTLVEHYSPSGCNTPTPSAPTNTPTLTDTPTPSPSPQPTVCPNPFVDINGDVFFYAINYLYCHGGLDGVDATHYNPTGLATRAEFAKVVVVALGVPLITPASGQTFTDVPPSYFAYVYIESGYAAGILSGYNDNTCTAHGVGIPCYLPDLPITRAQLTKLVVNAAHYPLVTPSDGQTFTDVPPSNVFYVSIETAVAEGVVHGYPANLCTIGGQAYPCFLPNNNIRRDEMAQIVYAGQQNQPASPTPSDTPAPSMTDTPTTMATPFATDTPGGPTSTFTPTPMPSMTLTPTALRLVWD